MDKMTILPQSLQLSLVYRPVPTTLYTVFVYLTTIYFENS